jgi:hypothetical protein
VGPSTLSDWKRSYPEFARALDTEKYEPDVIREVEVEDATDGDCENFVMPRGVAKIL